MRRRIGILTGGGDCPGLNAAIRAVVKHASGVHGMEVIGVKDAFKGLYDGEFEPLPQSRVRGLLDRGGTILGSSNRANPFAFPVGTKDGELVTKDVSAECVANAKAAGLEALIVVGGDGTQGIAYKMMEQGLPVVGIPKTIDNDLAATEFTIGYQTAVDVATEAIDRLHSTAESHDRIILCEVMGRYAGWIALNAGISSGAEAILIPEIDYDIDRLIACIEKRRAQGISFSIVVVAEGAKPVGGEYAELRAADASQQALLGGAGERLARDLRAKTDFDVRCTVLGHVQRGGTPAPFDRLLASRFGVAAVQLCVDENYGRCVALQAGEIVDVPMQDAVSELKTVDPKGPLVTTAKALGIELGG